jgi:hypothetical protein
MKIGLGPCALVLSLLFAYQSYGGIAIDGGLSDWGVSVADNNGSNFGVPAGAGQTTLGDGSVMYYHLEDQHDLAGHSTYLEPNYGGQDYDAEFMGVVINGTQLSIAIVTGQRPDNGLTFFGPGDIRIQTSQGVFAVEVGGGMGGGSGTAIVEGALGTTYRLNSSGETKGVLTSDGTSVGDLTGPNPQLAANAMQTAGSIWKDPQWILDPIVPQGPTQMQFVGGTRIGDADYIYTRNSSTNQHSVIELTLNAALLGGGTIESVFWRPSCGNDELNVDVDHQIVPEAGTFVSWGLLAVCATVGVALRRRANQPVLRPGQ